MNTPAHLIFGAAAFAKEGQPRVTTAALLGALAPDLSLYLMASWHLFLMGTDAEIVFRVLYYSDTWQAIFAVDNSFFVWGGLLGFALWAKSPAFIAFAGAGLLHLALDFPLHNDDARAHFWPATDWKFISPVSYWDRNHYAGVVGPIEMVASVTCLAILWRRFQTLIPRLILTLAALMQLAPVFIWVFVFDR
ncbi:cobalamin biosynthesis protein CobQ [uncultured Litoreibacter sp.]|uniref:cobalamin biosynthesis protein CobQ n=1 Tax=uncultured Litoreibacter sp. TaxID=1392394 RepID=UPI00260E122C|nr:cobalamin biosynthesis protein CobQ [uncultured Litoreibacter sp.]